MSSLENRYELISKALWAHHKSVVSSPQKRGELSALSPPGNRGELISKAPWAQQEAVSSSGKRGELARKVP